MPPTLTQHLQIGNEALTKAAAALLAWFDDGVHAARDMPWRRMRDPYAIWLSETMLQQTQVETVKPYFRRFLASFPTVADLARADLESVLRLWAGLGYYRRARHLHQAAQRVVAEHGGQLPREAAALRQLPGIGRYTAGAVASMAFGQAEPAVDGNVIRVLARLTGDDRDMAQARNREAIWDAAAVIVRGAQNGYTDKHSNMHNAPRYGDVNQALMELGATVCLPARPACARCPLRALCRAQAQGRQADLPVKQPKRATPVVHGVAVVVVRSGKPEAGRRKALAGSAREVLLMRRPMGGLWEGLWEFPVLRREKERTAGRTRAAGREARQVAEELGLAVKQVRRLGRVRHQLTHRTCHFEVLQCVVADRAEPKLAACGEGHYTAWRWVEWPLDGGLAMARVVEKVAKLCLLSGVSDGQ